ncbi:MAG TPA: hypothetical protein VH678_20745 [Xanthobacteraceae bacterium]|jgi:hypothetical protein
MAAVAANKWGGVIMSRVIAVVACGFTVAACSASIPSLNFLNSSPPTAAVRFESEPMGAEVKTSSAQSCRTPCELTIQVAPELSATFTLAGYQSETVAVRSEEGSFFSSPKLTPNPVHVELRAVPAAPAKKMRKHPAVASTAKRTAPVASASAAPPPSSAAAPAPASNEAAASSSNYPWPEPPSAKQ